MSNQLIRNFLAAWKSPRWRWALAVAAVSDAVGFGLVMAPPLHWAVDAITAVLLFVVLGFRWGLLVALSVEVVPALQVFPAWTLVVLALASTEKRTATQEPRAADPASAQSRSDDNSQDRK